MFLNITANIEIQQSPSLIVEVSQLMFFLNLTVHPPTQFLEKCFFKRFYLLVTDI
jgi:hypothetical protein